MDTRTDDHLIDITKQLVSIESTAGKPKKLKAALDVIVQMIITSGKNITVEHFVKNGVPSLLAYSGKKRPKNFRIILSGHLDVVPGAPEQFKPFIKTGKLYGRGVYDMKAAAVVLTDVFCEYVDQVPYALGLQIVTDEETAGHNGAEYQISQGVRGDFIICGECGRHDGDYEIANESKGIAWVDLEFSGTAAHGAYPWLGENAIVRAADFMQKILQRYPIPTQASSSTTVNIATINSNNKAGHTKVPDLASLRIEVRFTHDDPNFRTEQHLAALIEEIDPGARIVGLPAFAAPIYTNPRNPLLLQLKAAAEKVEGHKFKLVRRNGTSDGRFFASVGDQACEFGIAGQDHHGAQEHITIEAFKNYRKTMREFLAHTIKTEARNTNTIAYTAAQPVAR